jgi:hypothetical protein
MADKLPDDGLSEERIRVRAYEIFLRRGGQGGAPESDWLLAREELIKEAGLASASPASPAGGKARTGTGTGKAAVVETAPPPEPAAAPPKRSVRNVRSNTASRRGR